MGITEYWNNLRWPWQKQIGWEDVGEDFIRYTLLKTPLFRVYLHRLIAPVHAHCHDHPWDFIAILLKNGYWEYHNNVWTKHKPGEILFRKAEYSHVVVTATNREPSWSLVFVSPKRREWSVLSNCHE